MAPLLPDATEIPTCPLCGSARDGIVVGTRGRFGMSVRNVACPDCALVYQSPRPTLAAMAAYYGGVYREHYAAVKYPTPDGPGAGPGDPGYEAALEAWHSAQAGNVLALARPKANERILEIGCRHARTLSLLRERAGIEPFGVEPGPEEAAQAQKAGVQCFCGTIEQYEPGELKFDVIQLFHVLEHLHDPLAALLRMRSWLSAHGRLVLEVPNVYQPYGLLEENFFQNAHLTNFSVVTLPALLLRAGYKTVEALDHSTLFAVAVPDSSIRALPRAFEPTFLSEPSHTAQWVADRLKTYAELEKLRLTILSKGLTLELLNHTAKILKQPGFVPHTVSAVTELAEFLLSLGAPRAAYVIAAAAAEGPHAPEVRQGFSRFVQAIASLAQNGVN